MWHTSSANQWTESRVILVIGIARGIVEVEELV